MVEDDEIVLVEKHVRHTDSLVQQAATVVAQIEDQSIELWIIELLHRVGQIAVGRFVERGDAHIADAWPNHRKILDAGARNFVANHGDFDRLVPTFARDGDMDGGALGALQHVCHFVGAEAVAGLSVDFGDHVAGANSGLECRRADERCDHDRLIFARGDRHAHAVIFALLLFAEECVLLGIEEIRMRIEHMQHSGNRAVVDDLVHVDWIGVVSLDDREDASELLHRVLACRPDPAAVACTVGP